MKKVILMITLLFAIGNSIMAENNFDDTTIQSEFLQERYSGIKKYDFTMDYNRIGKYVGMTSTQIDQSYVYYDTLKNDMLIVYNDHSGVERDLLAKKTVMKNIYMMRYVLDTKQYHKYLVIMDVTLHNRGFNIAMPKF